MNATLHAPFNLLKGEARQKGIRYPRFARHDYYLPPNFAAWHLCQYGWRGPLGGRVSRGP
jgi:hypothetical protein